LKRVGKIENKSRDFFTILLFLPKTKIISADIADIPFIE